MNPSSASNKVSPGIPKYQFQTYPAMKQSNLNFSSLSQNTMNTSVSFHSLLGTDPSSRIHTIISPEPFTDIDKTFNEFDAGFGFVSNSYPEPPSAPESPSYSHSHSHSDTTGDSESGEKGDTSSKPRTMSTRKRQPGHRKTPQPQEQILKRRVQNRAAQRSFRERQKEYVHDLEHQVEQLKGEMAQLHSNYQDLLKAVTSAPRIPQWSGDLSPADTLDELECAGEVGGNNFEPIKVEGNSWPASLENQSLFY